MTHSHVFAVLKVTLLLLVLPVLGNLFIEGFDWGPLDFAIMGALWFLTGVGMVYAWHAIQHPTLKILACCLILFLLLTIWAELAVQAVSQALASF